MDTGGRKDSGISGEVDEGQPPKGCLRGDSRRTNGVPSQGGEAEIPRVFWLSEPTAISEAGYLTITLKSSSYCLENPQDDIPQDNYHISSSKVWREEILSQDNALSSFPSRHDGNAPELVDDCKYSGSSLIARGDQMSHGQTIVVDHSWVDTDQHCHKVSLPRSQDTALVVAGNVGAELVKGIDWQDKRTCSIEAEVQSTHKVMSHVKQPPSHGKLAIRSVPKPEPQNSRHSFDGTPHTNSTKEATKTYGEHINNLKTLGEARDNVSAFSKYRRPAPLDVPSSPAHSTELAAPRIVSTPIDNVGSHLGNGSWASHGNFSDPKPLPECLFALPSLSNDGGETTLTRCGSESNGSNSEQSEYRPSKKPSRTDQNGRRAKRKRLLAGGGNGDGANEENDENDDGEDSTQRKPDKSFPEVTKKGLLACPFYKNDPAYFAANLFHDGKYFICATRGFPDIARLKEHIYRKHSLPFTCSRCGDIFKSKLALDAHLPVRNPEKITCEVRTLPPSTTKGLTPDMERELRSRSKNGATPTMEAVWIDMYKKLFPGTHMPSSGPYLTNSHGPSGGIEEREEYIQFSERELPGLVQVALDATGLVLPQDRDLLISVMKSCLQKLPGMFLQARETSKSRLASERRSLGRISESSEIPTETMTFSPSAHRSFQPDYENVHYGSEGLSVPFAQFDPLSFFPPDIRSMGHIPSTDSWHDSGYDSSSRGSKSIYSHSGSDHFHNYGSSSRSTWDDSGSGMFTPLGGQEFVDPMTENVDNSTADFDFLWSVLPLTAGSHLERYPPGENSESTASNIISGSGAISQASSQSYHTNQQQEGDSQV